MTINEAVAQLQSMAAQDLKGGESELVLFDRSTERELRVDADEDRFDFEILRGDGEVAIEFN